MNKFNKVLLVFVTALLLACAAETDSEPESKYMRWVGDSAYDDAIDDSTFQICYYEHQVKQYFNFSEGFKYEGEKSALEETVHNSYVPIEIEQSGWIRIRFVVNCKGETGRFRITQSDTNYKETVFDSAITDQLLSITKSLDGWMKLPTDEDPQDYYLYLIFKIDNGSIIEIMP